jgi:hypothetical protein
MTANREPSNQSFEVDREATVCSASRRFFLRLVAPSCTVIALVARVVATSFFLLHALDDVLALAQEAIASAHVFCHCCATCM